jgi:hypothetical protein
MGYDRQRLGAVRIWATAGVVLGLVMVPVTAGAQSFPPPASMSVQGTVAPRPAAKAVATTSTSASPDFVVPAPSGAQNAAASSAVPDAPVTAQTSVPGDARPASSAPGEIREASLGATTGTAAIKPVLKRLGEGGIKAAAKKLGPAMARALKEFETAKETFTGFCEQWHQKLVYRQVNDVKHIEWKLRHGIETGTYVSYGPIESCVCKQADNGVPIGEITYKEMDYTLTGKTIGQAKQAKPAVNVVPTREIFSWDKGKWFY